MANSKPKPKPRGKSNLEKDKDTGKCIAGPGRKKGSQNKITREAKEAIAMVFEEKGGVDGLLAWACANKTNETIFYSHIYTKLIPVQVQGKMDVNVRSDLERGAVDGLKSALLGVIAAQRIAGGSPENPVIIDASPSPESDALLVLSSSSGTKAA